jgi:hypothetical protein
MGVQRPAITKHLKNIFDSGELQEDSVSSILEHIASDGKNTKQNSTTTMPSFRSATAPTPTKPLNSAGQPEP